MKTYSILVTGKEGIFDPAGQNSMKALEHLGYAGVENVSVGKYISVQVADDVTEAQVVEMCEKLLANPVIEDFAVTLESGE